MNGIVVLIIIVDYLLICVGCYISKFFYVRFGEKSLDNFYRFFYVVEYYRYVRFFFDGKFYVYFFFDSKLNFLGV